MADTLWYLTVSVRFCIDTFPDRKFIILGKNIEEKIDLTQCRGDKINDDKPFHVELFFGSSSHDSSSTLATSKSILHRVDVSTP